MGLDNSSLPADPRCKLVILVWGSAAAYCWSTFIRWTRFAVTLSQWQHYKHWVRSTSAKTKGLDQSLRLNFSLSRSWPHPLLWVLLLLVIILCVFVCVNQSVDTPLITVTIAHGYKFFGHKHNKTVAKDREKYIYIYLDTYIHVCCSWCMMPRWVTLSRWHLVEVLDIALLTHRHAMPLLHAIRLLTPELLR